MNQINHWKDTATESLTTMWNGAAEVVPSVIGAIIVLFIGWIFTKIVVKLISKALKLAKADKIDDKLNEIELFEGNKLNFNIIKIVSSFVKWLMYIMLVIIVSDILGLKIISEEIGNLLRYLPKLLTGLAIFVIGLFVANFVKKALHSFFKSLELSGAKFISQLAFMLILVFISITALNQAGINTEIITSNVTLILGAFLGAFALALGLGARDVVSDLLKTFYTRKTYEIGKTISFNNVKGEIISVNEISLTLKTDNGCLIVPIKDIVENQVEIQD